MFFVQNISIYMNFGEYGRGGWTYSTIHSLFIIQKNGKSTRAWPILKQILHYFDFNFFSRMNNKNFRKRGLQGALLLFLYKVSIVVLIDFIAILITPGIFLIQIVNTNNTNMYLIHFHSKNIKMRFLKSWVFSFKPTISIHYPSQCGEINCVDISKDFTTACQWNIKFFLLL